MAISASLLNYPTISAFDRPHCSDSLFDHPILPSQTHPRSFLDGEPSNALSLPTWAVHVSSVIEWITAMGLVWQYGQVSGNKSWKGLSLGIVPLLVGAFCACVWHFFYNSESLEIIGRVFQAFGYSKLHLVAILISISHIPPPWKTFAVDKLRDPANDLE